MATIIKEAHLVCADVGLNNNKYWNAWLYDDGHIETEYGRIGVTGTRETVSQSGPSAFESLVAKKKKGKKDKSGGRCSVYTESRTIAAGEVKVSNVGGGDLLSIAREQIKTSSPALNNLIERLVKANIHTITKNTQVTFNSASGLFTTPLGVVTLDGIQDARKILSDCVPLVGQGAWDQVVPYVNQFLRIVPQNFGMRKLNVQTFLPDLAAIQKQNDLLDSLESSYQAMQTPAVSAVAPKTPTEQVFSVKLDILDDDRERGRIIKKYADTRKDMHVCSHLKVKNIYIVEIETQKQAYEVGRKVGTEMELWHGTKQANLLSILKSGLKVSPPSTARIAGKMFGNGVYFAIDSTKSLNYSFGYWDGSREKNCFMFLCPVSLGKYYVPAGAYESLPKSNYDSTWAKSGKSGIRNDEIIVYHNDRFDLKYLVEFE